MRRRVLALARYAVHCRRGLHTSYGASGMRMEDLLAKLVGFPTVVGGPNGDLMAFVQDYLASHGVTARLLAGPDAGRRNLFASIGPVDQPGYILSGHVDVVPAQEPEWLDDPFVLRRQGDRFIGRGAVDMKGFVAAVLSAVPDLVQMTLKAPIHIALSYDEEAGCRGVPHLIAQLDQLCAAPLGCFVGEPTGLIPVLRHKGKATLALKAAGVAGHSARPDLGANAIHSLLPVLTEAASLAAQLKAEGPRHAAFAPPYSTAQIGVLEGGSAINIIPEHARALIEARAIPGTDPVALLSGVMDAAKDQDVHAEIIASYPPLDLSETAPLADLAAELAGTTPSGAVSFGTEAGLFQKAGIPAIVCGPGDISRAHKPEEFITQHELAAARDMVLSLGRTLA